MLGIVGAGSMGSMMAQLFAEADLDVSIFDVSSNNVDVATKLASENPKTKDRVRGYKDYEAFVKSLGKGTGGRLFLFSITHGSPSDLVLGELRKYLKSGDIILDGGNEWYLNSERRMKDLNAVGVAYVGMGVSGGYQSARRGPSISPGADDGAALDKVMPILRKVAAKDAQGNPCVRKIGPGGSGHYVKMVHNGIEQGMLSTLCEAWGLLRFHLGLEFDEIGNIFKRWNQKGELKNNFLVSIGSDICLQRDPHDNSKHVLADILDKVVQDADDTEGTGVWSVMEAARNHISAPTIAAAHFFRIASANRKERLEVAKQMNLASVSGHGTNQPATKEGKASGEFIEALRLAVYASFLGSYIQGLSLIARQSQDAGWGVKLDDCIQIWRAGCIIQSDYIAELLHPVLGNTKLHSNIHLNLLQHPIVSKEFSRTFPALRAVVIHSISVYDANIPAMSASLEWIKYVGQEKLPTMFMEAELDYFGAHKFDKWSDGLDEREGGGEVKKGKYHFEWKPA